jgi:H+/gluconate symporter-like permease
MALFQVVLILSGNLSFLNWLTLIPILACFSDREFKWLVPVNISEYLKSIKESATPLSTSHKLKTLGILVLVGCLSINPVVNFISSRQVMNASFTPLKIVNTYGAFGTVGRRRLELVIKGTRDRTIDESTEWKRILSQPNQRR